jgi:hypothetical protein
MFLLFLIFQQQGSMYERLEQVEKGQARLEGVVSTINFNNPAVPVNQSKEQRDQR